MVNLTFKNKTFNILSAASAAFVLSSSLAVASDTSFNAYPGTYEASFLNVEAANIINVSAKVWTGYPKSLRITLPNIDVPVNHAKAPVCQAKMVQDALDFTNKFMSEAKKVQVSDIYMDNTASSDATTNIVTNAGSLADALLSKGLARPASIDKKQPWC